MVSADTFGFGCTAEARQYEGMLVRLENVRVMPCENALTTAMLSAHWLIRSVAYYCEPNLLASDTTVRDKFGQMWLLQDGHAPSGQAPYPIQLEDFLVRIYDVRRVLPGMVWNVTGILSFSHGGEPTS